VNKGRLRTEAEGASFEVECECLAPNEYLDATNDPKSVAIWVQGLKLASSLALRNLAIIGDVERCGAVGLLRRRRGRFD
jgi:hypothetical protein